MPTDLNELLKMLFSTVTQHIPVNEAWMPVAGLGLVALFGVILLAKGAKLFPLMAGLTFLGLGGIGGSFAANAFGSQPWITIITGGVVGFLIGLFFFRIWLAVLVATCLSGGALTVYYFQVLEPYAAGYTSFRHGAPPNEIGIPAAGTVVNANKSQIAELGNFWNYLSQSLPSFQTSFFAITVSTALAGLIVGLFLPRFSRALWAASSGTFFLMLGLTALLQAFWPAGLEWLATSLGRWGWGLMGAAWILSFFHNLFDGRKKQAKQATTDEPPAAMQPAPAMVRNAT